MQTQKANLDAENRTSVQASPLLCVQPWLALSLILCCCNSGSSTNYRVISKVSNCWVCSWKRLIGKRHRWTSRRCVSSTYRLHACRRVLTQLRV